VGLAPTDLKGGIRSRIGLRGPPAPEGQPGRRIPATARPVVLF